MLCLICDQHLKGVCKKDGSQLLWDFCDRRRGDGSKLRVNLDEMQARSFLLLVVKHRHRLPREEEDPPSLGAFRAWLDGALSSPL